MYFDMHIHCIPGVDDGAPNMEEALAMLEISRQNGVNDIIATPHHHYRRGHAAPAEILEKVEQLNTALQKLNPDMHIYPGNEIYYSHDVTEQLKQGEILTMAGSSYVLIEFSPGERFERIREGLSQVAMAGYYPILAHLERVECLVEDISLVYELDDMGVYFQANIPSFHSVTSRSVKRFLKHAVNDQLIDFLATDAHHASGRSPEVRKDLAYINKKFGSSFVYRCLYQNPLKIIKNELI